MHEVKTPERMRVQQLGGGIRHHRLSIHELSNVLIDCGHLVELNLSTMHGRSPEPAQLSSLLVTHISPCPFGLHQGCRASFCIGVNRSKRG